MEARDKEDVRSILERYQKVISKESFKTGMEWFLFEINPESILKRYKIKNVTLSEALAPYAVGVIVYPVRVSYSFTSIWITFGVKIYSDWLDTDLVNRNFIDRFGISRCLKRTADRTFTYILNARLYWAYKVSIGEDVVKLPRKNEDEIKETTPLDPS